MKLLILLTLFFDCVKSELIFDGVKGIAYQTRDRKTGPVAKYVFYGNQLNAISSFWIVVEIKDQHVAALPRNSVVDIDWIEEIAFINTETKRIHSFAFNRLPKLQVLEIRDNAIDHLPADVFNCPNLETLIVVNNQVEILDLKALARVPKLKTLDLSRNRLKTVKPTTFHSNRKLNHINLSDNSLSYIEDDTFSHLEYSIRDVMLSDNGMEKFSPHVFSWKATIANLMLDGNKLTEVDFTQQTRKVGLLNVNWNLITCMNSKMIKNVIYFYADANPWRCECLNGITRKNIYTETIAPNEFKRCGIRQSRVKH